MPQSSMVWLGLLLSFLCFTGLPYAQSLVGTATIQAPAVIIQNNSGSLTTIDLAVLHGTGSVSINGPAIVGTSTLQSATTAAQYAAKYAGVNFADYNFTYTILDASSNVSGPSAGAAFTILGISALTHGKLLDNFTMTGTISPSGAIGPIGGVYDKVAAAKAHGLSFVLVPAVPAGSQTNELYALVEDLYGIPLVEVANISQAAAFAFGNRSVTGAQVTYSPYTDLHTGALPVAPLSCSNGCDEAPFWSLANFTLNITYGRLYAMRGIGNFSNLYQGFDSAVNQDAQIVRDGYLYAGADQAFLNYVGLAFLSNYSVTESSGLGILSHVEKGCYSLSPPPLTSTNYEYLIAGELRQLWGEYTINTTIALYNTPGSIQTTDDVLSAISQGAGSAGWCAAASELYGLSASMGGANATANQSLAQIAAARITRSAASGPSMYTATAEAALKAGNYPLAIVDADYGYAINTASAAGSNTTAQLLNMSSAIADNSTYGAWATQFANEAAFYIWEALHTTNTSQAKSYSESAYSAALLAYQMSNDTRLIAASLAPGYSPQSIGSVPGIGIAQGQQTNQTTGTGSISISGAALNAELMQYMQNIYVLLFVILIVVLLILVVLIGLISLLGRLLKTQRELLENSRQVGRGTKRNEKG